jgi:hypothetical protein
VEYRGRYRLVVDLKDPRPIGLTVSASFLVRADPRPFGVFVGLKAK